jgi:hypothetical protein
MALSCFNPRSLFGQGFPPSMTLQFDTGPAGQIGGTVQTLGPGPSTIDLGAASRGEYIQPILLAMASAPVIEPLYDPTEFPNGPKRVTIKYSTVTLPASVPLVPGFVGTFLPARLDKDLTPAQFIASYLADYLLEVNGLQFMDAALLKPENIVRLGPLDNQVLSFLPPGDFYIWGLNITMKFKGPGTYRIRNIMRIPKTIPIPELNAAFLAGQFINEITVQIAPPGAPNVSTATTAEGPVAMGGLPTVDEAFQK